MTPSILLLLSLSSLSSSFSSSIPTTATRETFQQCFSVRNSPSVPPVAAGAVSQILYTPNTPSYSSVLFRSLQNLRFSSLAPSQKPSAIVVPTTEAHVRAAIVCSRHHGLLPRIRSGGHDYEGLSYRSATGGPLQNQPFIIIDLSSLRSVAVDSATGTAWVQSGATVGELYYRISKISRTLAFPAGLCAHVGVGGQLGGGGFGTLLRKHGLAADNVLDARVVDARGSVLDRASMGEDLFWAIRGGGAGSFGVVVTWKVRLVPVPPTVTAFSITRTLQQNAIPLLHKWQSTAPNLHRDLFVRVILHHSSVAGGQVAAVFNSLFLGRCADLVRLMNGSFGELGMSPNDCMEMTWVQSALYFAGYRPEHPPELLLNRDSQSRSRFKAKSDFVQEPISERQWRAIWDDHLMRDARGMMIMDPFGGRMSEIPEGETPFPHRKGNLYNIQYLVQWEAAMEEAAHMRWINGLYGYMEGLVSKDPRGTYVNYRDLDLGSGWGKECFKGNWLRLVEVKGRVDGGNLFRSEQSVPPTARRRGEVTDDEVSLPVLVGSVGGGEGTGTGSGRGKYMVGVCGWDHVVRGVGVILCYLLSMVF